MIQNKLWRVTIRKHAAWTFDGRTYKVSDRGVDVASCTVYAPNRRFARWNSEKEIGYIASWSIGDDAHVYKKHVSKVQS